MSTPTTKIVTLAELNEHKTRESMYVLLHEKVYDVTKFLSEHPGGDEVILAESGKDATEAFDDVGHSDEARALLVGMLVGNFEKGSGLKTVPAPVPSAPSVAKSNTTKAAEQGSNSMYFLPLTLLAAYFAWRFYSSGSF